ncbi:MAG TPA: hypothetical protein VI603_16640 [Saprospiraceae bacterium]|nr:hypothetical protein [Saprospiraceae bacterium]
MEDGTYGSQNEAAIEITKATNLEMLHLGFLSFERYYKEDLLIIIILDIDQTHDLAEAPEIPCGARISFCRHFRT